MKSFIFLILLTIGIPAFAQTGGDPEVMPEFPGGEDSLRQYLKNNVHYPMQAFVNKQAGIIVVQFTVTAEGDIKDAKAAKSFDDACKEEALRVVNAMPRWKPGSLNGKPQPVVFNLPVKFQIDQSEPVKKDTTYTPPDTGKAPPVKINMQRPVLMAEQMPAFPGGEDSLQVYLHQNLKYPAEAQKKKTEGTVALQFVVGPDGRISDIRTVNGVEDGCTAEAIRLVKAMPKWTPGKNKDEVVPVLYNLSVVFKLEADTKKDEEKK